MNRRDRGERKMSVCFPIPGVNTRSIFHNFFYTSWGSWSESFTFIQDTDCGFNVWSDEQFGVRCGVKCWIPQHAVGIEPLTIWWEEKKNPFMLQSELCVDVQRGWEDADCPQSSITVGPFRTITVEHKNIKCTPPACLLQKCCSNHSMIGCRQQVEQPLIDHLVQLLQRTPLFAY